MLFLKPGVDETLRINGAARMDDDPDMIRYFAEQKNVPKLVIAAAVAEVYLHCAKVQMRSKSWSMERQVDRSVLPTMGQMMGVEAAVQAALA